MQQYILGFNGGMVVEGKRDQENPALDFDHCGSDHECADGSYSTAGKASEGLGNRQQFI